jgi:hypothetical protein
MSYNQVAHSAIDWVADDGSVKTYECILSEFNGLDNGDELLLTGEITIEDGDQKDTLFKGVSSTSVTLEIKDSGDYFRGHSFFRVCPGAAGRV